MSLPLAILDLDEEDESAVALNIHWDPLEVEALCNGSLHLSNASLLGKVDVGQGAVLSVHDEVAVGSALNRDIDELLNGETTGPCWSTSQSR